MAFDRHFCLLLFRHNCPLDHQIIIIIMATAVPAHKHFAEVASVSTAPTTPFNLAMDESFSDDVSIGSSNEGIEVLGADYGDGPSPQDFIGWTHLWSGKIVRSRLFKRGVLFNILLVSVIMGIATVDSVRENPPFSASLDGVLRFFRVVFTIELLLDVVHYQRQVFKIGWVVFDIVILILSWTVSLSLLVVRSFRLIRALRKASGVSDLKHIVKALLRVIPRILAILFLLVLILYIFTTIFTDLYQDMYAEGHLTEDYFGRLDRTAFTLFRIMTLDNWTEIAEQVMVVYPWSCVFFVAYIVTTTFFFGSLVIAVVADAFNTIGRERMIKALEDPKAVSLKSSRSHEVARLEEKIAQLAQTVDSLVQLQSQTQATLNSLAQSKSEDEKGDVTSSSSSS